MNNRDSDISEPGEVTAIVSPQTAAPEVIDVLRECPLFHNFSTTGLHIIGRIMREKIVPAGTPLFVENMVAESFYVVLDGEIAIMVSTPDGHSVPMVCLTRGASFGELGAICAGSRMCSAVAQTESCVLEISRRDLGQLQQSKPQACVKLMTNVNEMFAQRLRESQDEFTAFLNWRIRGAM